ncbi:MAG: LD-carboxypeptidase [Armatimonadota bacterium]
MVRPRSLRPGSHIRIVTPASPLTPTKVERSANLLEDQGYKLSYAKHAFDHFGYLAASDEKRAADLMEAFLDPEVDAVICSRGGYGCARLFPYLDLDAIANTGKMFAGFSDITTLHTALNRRGLVTFHAPMLITLGSDREPWVIESFLKALRGEDPLNVNNPPATCLNPGVAEGQITGGCLVLLSDSIGTAEPPDFKDKIVLIEDVEELPHRVDALLTHLINANLLQQAAGIVIGEMTRTDEKRDLEAGDWTWREIVEDRVKPLSIPTMIDFPMGHAKQMLTIPLGVTARMDASAGTLTLLEPSCVA